MNQNDEALQVISSFAAQNCGRLNAHRAMLNALIATLGQSLPPLMDALSSNLALATKQHQSTSDSGEDLIANAIETGFRAEAQDLAELVELMRRK